MLNSHASLQVLKICSFRKKHTHDLSFSKFNNKDIHKLFHKTVQLCYEPIQGCYNPNALNILSIYQLNFIQYFMSAYHDSNVRPLDKATKGTLRFLFDGILRQFKIEMRDNNSPKLPNYFSHKAVSIHDHSKIKPYLQSCWKENHIYKDGEKNPILETFS